MKTKEEMLQLSMEDIYVCKECGSDQIRESAMLDYNTRQEIRRVFDPIWCDVCDCEVAIVKDGRMGIADLMEPYADAITAKKNMGKKKGIEMGMFEVTVYSTREYHHDQLDYTFTIQVEAPDAEEAMQLVEEECVETGCDEACEVHSASEVR
jgi:hypothetical protein